MTKIEGIGSFKDLSSKVDDIKSLDDVKNFLKQFSSVGEAKDALSSIISEVKKTNPALAAKIEKLLETMSITDDLDKLIDNLDRFAAGNITPGFQTLNINQITHDNTADVTDKINHTSSLA